MSNQDTSSMLVVHDSIEDRRAAAMALQKYGFCLIGPVSSRRRIVGGSHLFRVTASSVLGERRFALSDATKAVLAHAAPKQGSHFEPESGFAWSDGKEAYHFTSARTRRRRGGFHPSMNERVEFADGIFRNINGLLIRADSLSSVEAEEIFPNTKDLNAWLRAVENSKQHVMSFFRYHGSNPSNLHADAHVDKGVFTLCENTNDIEVFVRGKWVSLGGQDEGVVAVLAGYSLERATGGIFQAVRHRVRNSGDRQALVTKIRFDPRLVIYPPSVIANAPPTWKEMIPDPTDLISVKDMIEAFNNTHRSVNASLVTSRLAIPKTRTYLNVTGNMGHFSDLPVELLPIILTWLWGDIRDSFRAAATCRSFRAICGSEEHIVPAAEIEGFPWDQSLYYMAETESNGNHLPKAGFWLKVLGRTLYHKMQPLTIRIKDGNGEETHFKVRATLYMVQIFIAFAQRKGTSRATIRFLLDGERLDDFDKPYSLDLEDGDMLDAVLEQTGD